MAYLIYGARGSGSSIVEAACAELGVDYEVRDLDVRGEEQRGDAYAALNPRRKLPTLRVDGGEIVTRWDMTPAWRRDHLPKVEALAAAVRARPAVAPVWARHFG
jgi:glutaredoxin